MRKFILLGAWMISCALLAEGVDPIGFIHEALQHGETTVRLPKGVYDLEPGDVASLHLKDLKDVVLDFQGSEFRGKKKSGMLKLQSCRGVTIRNLTIDYPFNLPFTQGFIEQVGTNGEWTVRIAKGYPDPEDGRWGWPVQAYDVQTGDLVNPMRYLDGIKVSRLEPGRYRVTGGRNRKGKVGDVAVWSLPCDTVDRTQSLDTRAHAVYLVDCANCRVENVTVHSTPGSNGFREILGAGGNVYSHCTVVPRPPETDPVVREIRRFRSGNHDAFNSRAVKKGPLLLACTARNHCDDDVNIHGPYQFITAVEGAKVRAFIRDMYVGTLRVGDPVQFVTAKGYSPEYTLKVVDIAPAKPTEAELAYVKKGLVNQIARACNTMVEVVFERADPILQPGTLFVSQNAAGNGFSLQSCTFGPNRARGFICNASYGEVVGCTFDRTESSGVLSRPSYQWLEGGASRNVRFRDCTFIDCGVNFGVHREMMTTNECHRNVVFSGCRFSGPKGRLEVACCADLDLHGNRFEVPEDKAVSLKLVCSAKCMELPVGDSQMRREKLQVSFARGKWNPADFIPVKSWRNTYIGEFEQREDAIVNMCPDLPGETIFREHCSDVYAAMVYRRQVSFGSKVSSRMAFDHRMAPLIALAPTLERNTKGAFEFREHWEIVLYDRGLNVWHHYFEEGKQKWIKAAALELPEGVNFQKDKIYDLGVRTKFNSRGRREMIVTCAGYTLSYVDDALPDLFYAGIVGCEGRNFFYDLRIE